MAKYNFTGNPDRPGGFDELSITQGENLTLLVKGHLPSKNHLWWEVRNGNGKVGFVPANYCMVRGYTVKFICYQVVRKTQFLIQQTLYKGGFPLREMIGELAVKYCIVEIRSQIL